MYRPLIPALLLAALLLPACKPAPPDPGTARVHFQQEPDALNPYLSAMQATASLSSLFYSGLVTLDDEGRWVPDLATRVPTLESGDVTLGARGMRVRYRLRPGVTWHDGEPLTSRDVEATWRLLMDPAFPGLSTAGYDQITAVETPDPLTAVVVYEGPYAPYHELFPFILPAHRIAGAAKTPGAALASEINRAPVGSGPFRFASWQSGERLVATANERYFRGRPAVARVEVRFVPQEDTAFSLWRAGGLDLLQNAPATEYDFLQREAPGRVHVTSSASWEHLLFNMEDPILKEAPVRRAIAHLLDRELLNAKAYGGVSQPAWSEVPTWSWAYHRGVEHKDAFDPARARQLLDAAGWKPGPGGLREKGGRKLQLALVTTTDKPARALAAQIWRRQWREAGIGLTIERLPASALFGAASSGGRLATGEFALALVAGVSRPDPDTLYRWGSAQVPPNGQNRARYKSPEADALLKAGQATIAPARRRPLYARLAERLAEDRPMIPLLYWASIDVTSERLKGFKPNPTLRGNLWNVWEWRVEDGK